LREPFSLPLARDDSEVSAWRLKWNAGKRAMEEALELL